MFQKHLRTKPSLLRRVKAIKKRRSANQRIRPYNFVLVGSPTMFTRRAKPIVPITPFVRPCDLAPFQSLIDASSGKPYNRNTEVYWKKLDTAVEEYVDHPESKFRNGDRTGKMHRRHLFVEQDGIKCIGKDSNEIEETEILGVADETYVEYL